MISLQRVTNTKLSKNVHTERYARVGGDDGWYDGGDRPQVILVTICGVGGLVFRYTEGAFETFYKCGVKRVKRDFLNGLWTDSRRMGEDQWKLTARRRLIEFEEQLHDAFEAGTTTYSGRSSWSFVNSAIYCFTVVTTIGKIYI